MDDLPPTLLSDNANNDQRASTPMIHLSDFGGVGDKRKPWEPPLPPELDRGSEMSELTADEIGRMLNAFRQGEFESLYPHVPVLRTWPSSTPCTVDRMINKYSLHKDAGNFGVELERGVFAPKFFIRYCAFH